MMYSTRKRKGVRWPKRLLLIGVLFVILGLSAAIIGRHIYTTGLGPAQPNSQSVQTVVIERGATLDQIARQLKQLGLIRSEWAFKLYVGSKDVRSALQAGTYSFGPNQTVAQIVTQLSHGKVTTDLVTIIPGQNLTKIKATLINYGFSEMTVDAALNPDLYRDNPALVDKPEGASLEGYLYPDSYQKAGDTKPQHIIEEALAQMDKKLTPDLRQAFAAHGLSTYQAIILASIVEREVAKPEDRAQVAQVFLRRLQNDIALQSDATKTYFDSYHHLGLPASPISNMSITSLQAVASPATTDWLYFVSGDDGHTHFSRTLSEQEANISRYCHKLCHQ